MIRENKGSLVLSSALCLLPGVLGLVLWDRLPELLSDHWGWTEPAATGTLLLTVLLPSLLGLGLQWLCVLLTARDPKNKGRNSKPFRIVLWIVPLVTNFNALVLFAPALGIRLSTGSLMAGVTGILFVVIGNYLPKCRQNHTIGIKLPWTFRSEENWNATHRFGGRVWVAGGLLCLFCALLPGMAGVWAVLAVIAAMVLLPIAYSYVYYRKQLSSGTLPEASKGLGGSSSVRGSLWFTGAVIALVLVLCFTGSVTVQFGDAAFTVKSTYWQSLTVAYSDIEALEFRESSEPGVRTWGFGSPRLSVGTFQNGEFGTYTRYAYTGCDACVILTVKGKTLVLSGVNDDATAEIYRLLQEKR